MSSLKLGSFFQFSAASITVFLSWFELLLLLQRFDQVGIYVVMFLEILQTLIKVLMVFSILIIAFGYAFYILLSKVRFAMATHKYTTYLHTYISIIITVYVYWMLMFHVKKSSILLIL